MNRLHHCWIWLIVASIIQLSAASSASAYSAWGAPWPGSPPTLTYSYVNMFDGGIKMPNESPLPNALIRGSIEESLRLWASVVSVNFVEIPNDGLNHPNHIRFRHIPINGPDPAPPGAPIAKAQATCIGASTGCEVQFDHLDRWQEVGTTPNPDILGASIHEVGHILGLHHTEVVGANMYWIFHRFQGLGTSFLLQDDIDGMRAIYGPGVGTVTAIPEPASLALIFFAAASLFLRRRAR